MIVHTVLQHRDMNTANDCSLDSVTSAFRADPPSHIDVGEGAAAHRTFGTGPDVLFVHGWPVSGATWRKLIPQIAPHRTCHVIDFPGTGDSRFGPDDAMSIRQHIETVRAVVDHLELDDVAIVGHDSGGMIARHALAGDSRVRAWGLVNTEQPQGLSWRFRMFLVARHLPTFGSALAWVGGQPRLRRHPLVLGGAFEDRSLLDGEFDEFFLAPLREDPNRLRAATQLLKSFNVADVDALTEIHRRIDVPVGLVWGTADPFFPIGWAREMVLTFANASLTEIESASLFSHEERPEAVASALLNTI